MTLAYPTAPLAVPPRGRTRSWSVSVADVAALGVLVALWAVVLPLGWASLPLQLWDESRNANNALEMALSGRWLTPTYGGVVDHWNTKPPLMIWTMAALLKTGMAPLLALRLPAMASALATVLAIWGVLRVALKDRLAAFASAALLLSASLYIGPHGARTADYDGPESAFIVGYVLSLWAALEQGRRRWVALAAACIALGVLTKGVAALLPLPGLAVYALTRPERLWPLARDPRAWAAVALCLLAVVGYYVSREAYDPGYLAAVAGNELGGRFLQVTERHVGGWDYYLQVLLREAEPGVLLAAVGIAPLAGASAPRRRFALACGLAALSLLVVLSASRSKMEWYAVPLVPLICPIAGLGLSQAVRWSAAGPLGAMSVRARAMRAACALVVVASMGAGVSWAMGLAPRVGAQAGAAQYGYGGLLEAARARALAPRLTVVDGGFYNDAGFKAYDPMLKFYAERSTALGSPVRIVHGDEDLADGEVVGSCDRRALVSLQGDYQLDTLLAIGGCRVFKVVGGVP